MKQAIQYLTAVGMVVGALVSQGVVAEDSVTATQDIGITVSEVAQIAVAENGAISFTVGDGTTAGAEPNIAPTNAASARLLYTSIVGGENETRTIQVKHGGNVPDGLALRLQVGAAAGNPQGDVGGLTGSDFADAAQLTDQDNQTAITGIGSTYTGEDVQDDGHLLTYSLAIVEDTGEDTGMAALRATSETVTVTYTLTAGSGN